MVEADSSSSEVEAEEAAPQTPDNVTVKIHNVIFLTTGARVVDPH